MLCVASKEVTGSALPTVQSLLKLMQDKHGVDLKASRGANTRNPISN